MEMLPGCTHACVSIAPISGFSPSTASNVISSDVPSSLISIGTPGTPILGSPCQNNGWHTVSGIA